MFPSLKPRSDPGGLRGSKHAGVLIPSEQKAHGEDTKTVAPLAHEVQDALQEAAALRAANYDNIDGRLPVETEHVPDQIAKELTKSPAAVAPEDQILREELLTNDSLGG